MDSSPTATVLQGTAITSAVCTFITGIVGIWRRNPRYGLFAGAAAVNSGVTAATFFSLREFIVGPALVSTLSNKEYLRRRAIQTECAPGHPSMMIPPTWSEMRLWKTLDSGLSGAVAGGALRGLRSGPHAAIPGTIAGMLVCTVLQMAFNEAGILRLKYISQSLRTDHAAAVAMARHGLDVQDPHPPFLERVLSGLGFKKVPDKEYLDMLKAKRAQYLQKIQELEAQIQKDGSREGKVDELDST